MHKESTKRSPSNDLSLWLTHNGMVEVATKLARLTIAQNATEPADAQKSESITALFCMITELERRLAAHDTGDARRRDAETELGEPYENAPLDDPEQADDETFTF